jgi:hypothetical protein
MSGHQAAPRTSHPTEPLVQGTHHLLHLRTDAEIKVFLARKVLVSLVLNSSLFFDLAFYPSRWPGQTEPGFGKEHVGAPHSTTGAKQAPTLPSPLRC